MHYLPNSFVKRGSRQTIKLKNEDEPENPDRIKSVSANPTAELTLIDIDKVAKMYEEQNKQCKEYLDDKNAFDPADDYNKYEPLIDADECKWLCYSPDFQELAECVDNVLDYDE